ncbi:hypothetical protein [Agrobacterium rosae]|uniref:Uncharacterized protein n=1 Tax=Agrobacterium rosae TaxID=1972867 RepID=A0AAW9FFX3_9HYPH|nr:hypothetical protein [Agrobacterium rosae]MDX8301713.1 hypothetical protein [Agrobacterium rosae]POO55006.1 hypothetical protein CTT39_17305 [Agrobacterium rosae]
MMKTILIAATMSALLGSTANSATFLDGAYGEKEGCTYSKTGESSGADEFFLLNDEGITTATAFCAFSGKPTKTATGFKIVTQCESEGDKGQKETVELKKTADGYTINFKDGTSWGPLPKCQ